MSQQQTPWQLTVDAVAHYPRPGTNAPGSFAFSPDGRMLTYLFSARGDLIRDLWALDVQTGERSILVAAAPASAPDDVVSPEEALRRERLRMREGGVTYYRWAEHADRLLLLLSGQIFVTSSAGDEPRPIAQSDSPAQDARFTPDGSHVVFVRNREVWAAPVESGEAWQLTSGATDTISNGLAEFIAQEEMGRSEGFWISPDGTQVAYEQADEGHIPVYPIVHQGTDEWTVESHRYPFAGKENARVRLGVVPLGGGPTRWLDLGPDPDIYLARIDWRPDGQLMVQIEARQQRALDLWRYDPATGERAVLLKETSDCWINLHRDLKFLEDGSFIWSSERSGFRHLYLYDATGQLVRQLTEGEWAVDGVTHLDEATRRVFFSAGRGNPTERHLFWVSLYDGAVEPLTDEQGWHGGLFSANGRVYVHTFESRTRPPSAELRSVDGGTPSPQPSPIGSGGSSGGSGEAVLVTAVHQGPRGEECVPGLRVPEIVRLASRDGTPLYGAIYRPWGGEAPFPTIVSVYGGPHAQMVTDTWGMMVDLRAQYLASLGFLVFKLDNRGSARRGLAFECAVRRRMGSIEVQDQVDGLRWLADQGLADPTKVGIYGWSYGGYVTAMCLLTAPNVFKVGVAGAPVTDWDGYDTHYTERYMDTPKNNPDGYEQSSAMTHAANLDGSLLLVHGMIDENVHFRHTARLLTALEKAGKPCDVLVLPAERHMPRDEAGRRYVEEQVAAYFAEQL